MLGVWGLAGCIWSVFGMGWVDGKVLRSFGSMEVIELRFDEFP